MESSCSFAELVALAGSAIASSNAVFSASKRSISDSTRFNSFCIIKNGAESLMETQLPNGYIGNYSEEAQLNQWDIVGAEIHGL